MSVGGKPRLLVFHRPRSGPDRRVDAFLAQVLQRRHNHETFAILRVNVDERADVAERFGVSSTPTLVVVDGGRVRARVPAPKGAAEIARALAPWLK
jgi:thioredoxin-like negative regulator of GroEL